MPVAADAPMTPYVRLPARLGRVACVVLSIACSSTPGDPPAQVKPPAPSGQPDGWADEIALPKITDLNPDPHILEVNLEAQLADVPLVDGKPTTLWTYNGGLPGPLLRARVGDRLIVHFKNSLPEPTSVHWHGLRIPNDMDGVPDNPHAPVAPGATFDYDFVLPDPGTYWYHPHYASAAQLGNGLYGPLIVDDPSEPAGLGDEAVVVLSDLSVNSQGVLEPADGGGQLGTVFGREGDIMLVNGKLRPSLHVRAGARQRFRFINAAKARYFQLIVPGNQLTRIGGDQGLIERPEALTNLVLTPAQRADVLVEPSPPPGENRLAIRWKAFDRGFGTTFNRPDQDVMYFDFADGAPVQNPVLPVLYRDIAAPDPAGTRPVNISLTLDTSDPKKVAMGINGVPSWKAEHIMAPIGERQLWTIKNTFDWAHPFHLHGYFFQVLDVNGVAPAIREWRDTVNVPVDATVRFVVNFDERPGMWMFHCHILDHADAGMMGMVHVH